MRKQAFCICEYKDADQLRGYLISFFVFATWIVQSLFYLNPKLQASRHVMWLYSPVCVGPGRKPKDLFSHDEAHTISPARPVSAVGSTSRIALYEPRCEKTGLRDFRPGPTQTGLYSHRRWLEA